MKKIPFGKINFILFILLIVLFVFLFLVPVRPLEIKDVKINGTSFRAGGEMSFTIDRCKNVDKAVSGTASRYFVDVDHPNKQAIFISSTDDLGNKGCAKVTRAMDIPAHIKDGTYKLKFVTRYYPSVLREPITVEYTTKETFTVKGQELSAQLNNILTQLESIKSSIGSDTVGVSSDDEDVTLSQEPSKYMADAAPTIQVTPLPIVNQPAPQQNQSTQPAPQSSPQGNVLTQTIEAATGLIRTITNSLPLLGNR